MTRASVFTFLVVLYSITVFITFVLSQAGMVRYWWSNRRTPHWKRRFLVSLDRSEVMCSFILIMMTALKFFEGGWITLVLLLMCSSALALLVRNHYDVVGRLLQRMDNLVQATLVFPPTADSVGRIMHVEGQEESTRGKSSRL